MLVWCLFALDTLRLSAKHSVAKLSGVWIPLSRHVWIRHSDGKTSSILSALSTRSGKRLGNPFSPTMTEAARLTAPADAKSNAEDMVRRFDRLMGVSTQR